MIDMHTIHAHIRPLSISHRELFTLSLIKILTLDFSVSKSLRLIMRIADYYICRLLYRNNHFVYEAYKYLQFFFQILICKNIKSVYCFNVSRNIFFMANKGEKKFQRRDNKILFVRLVNTRAERNEIQ